MGASKDRAFAALKVAFVACHGGSLRTAQRHASANSAEWQAFIGTQAVAGMRQPGHKPTAPQAAALGVMNPNLPKVGDEPMEALIPDDLLPEPLRIKKMQWQIYRQASIAWNAALKEWGALDGRVTMLGVATIKAQTSYNLALKAAEQYEISERRLIPFSEFQAVLPLLAGVFALIKNMPAEIAMHANNANPSLARQAAEDWTRNTFQPQANELLDKFEQYTSRPTLPEAA